MGELEKYIFDKIENNDLSELSALLSHSKCNLDIVNPYGMTPLLLAAYKGDKRITMMLLRLGADVNFVKPENGNSPLHYAALSGNAEVCQVLLIAGAKPDATNSDGCTPAHMASVFNNPACVAVIENFVPRIDVGPKQMNAALHALVLWLNIHPLRVALNVSRAAALRVHLGIVHEALLQLRDQEVERGYLSNEAVTIKLHYLAAVVRALEDCGVPKLRAFARRVANRDLFLRECIWSFPYHKSAVYRQLLTTLSQPDSPPALDVLAGAINGGRFLRGVYATYCAACDEEGASWRCTQCRATSYCDSQCCLLHAPEHDQHCVTLHKVTRRFRSPRPALRSVTTDLA